MINRCINGRYPFHKNSSPLYSSLFRVFYSMLLYSILVYSNLNYFSQHDSTLVNSPLLWSILLGSTHSILFYYVFLSFTQLYLSPSLSLFLSLFLSFSFSLSFSLSLSLCISLSLSLSVSLSLSLSLSISLLLLLSSLCLHIFLLPSSSISILLALTLLHISQFSFRFTGSLPWTYTARMLCTVRSLLFTFSASNIIYLHPTTNTTIQAIVNTTIVTTSLSL